MFSTCSRKLNAILAFAASVALSGGAFAGSNPRLVVDVGSLSSMDADDTIGLGIVAYGLGYHDGIGTQRPLQALDDYLETANSSSGDVVISTVGVQLRKITALTGSAEFDAELVELLGGELSDIVDTVTMSRSDHHVQLKIFCALPDHLSKYPGVLHDAQSGLLEPTEHPISACGPLKETGETLANGNTPGEEWAAIMEALSEYYRYKSVTYVIGSEPSNYFNGTFGEFLTLAKYTTRGLRDGNPAAEIGILDSADLRAKVMRRTNPVFIPEDPSDPTDDPNGRYDMTIQWYGSSLVAQYLEFIHDNHLDPIDSIQYKQPGRSPFPSVGAFWLSDAAYIDGIIKSLGPVNRATRGPVSLVVGDYPHWHTSCRDPIENTGAWNGGESIWDSEYLAAFYGATQLGISAFNQQIAETNEFPNIAGIEVQLGYLVNWGVDTFFARSCEADGSRPAGFGGAIALHSYRTYFLKPVALVVSFLNALDGALTRVHNTDPNLFASAAYRAAAEGDAEAVTLVLTEFVPTESQVSTYLKKDGQPRIELGHIWNNNYGLTGGGFTRYCPTMKCSDPFQICCTSPEFQDLVYDPNGFFPRNLTRELILGNADPTSWGLPPSVVQRMLAVQAAGRANRKLPDRRNLSISVRGLEPRSSYLVSLNTVDDSVSNAYRDRYTLEDQLDHELSHCENSTCISASASEYRRCVNRCLNPLSETLWDHYSFNASAIYANRSATTNEDGVLELTLHGVRKNSVHLLRIEQG